MSTFKCHVCGGEVARNKFVNEVLEVEGRRVLVEHIPAEVCTRCGEATFSRETTERIRLLVHGEGRPAGSVRTRVGVELGHDDREDTEVCAGGECEEDVGRATRKSKRLFCGLASES